MPTAAVGFLGRVERERAVGFTTAVIALFGGGGAATAAPSVAALAVPARSEEDRRQIVLIPNAHVSQAPRKHFDPCALDPDGAILLLTEEEIAALNVPFVRRGSLVEHVRTFWPARTMAAVGVPSISRLLGEPVPVRGFQGVAARAGIPLDYTRYHTPQEGVTAFEDLAAKYPNIARLESLGQSLEGRDLWALRISDFPALEEPSEQKIFFCALHHAREWATHEMVLYLAEYLTTGYESDARVKNIVDHAVVWILLCENPDGFEYSWEVERFWRLNRRLNRDGAYGVNLNRNYDYRWGIDNGGSSPTPGDETYRGLAPASEPETQAVQSFLAREKPTIAITYHTYSQLVLFPWGYAGQVLPQAYSSMRAIGEQYARCVHDLTGMPYTPGQRNYTLYATNGDFTDYAYGAHGVLAFTPELRPISYDLGGFVLPEDEILPNNQENLQAALWMMDNIADARFVGTPHPNFVERGRSPFSLPLTPLNVKPERALNMSSFVASRLSVWFDDLNHPKPSFGTYPQYFEGVGSGCALFFNNADRGTGAWADAFTGYRALPYIFDGGAAIMLENYQPGMNHIGIPSEHSVALRDVQIVRRILSDRQTDFGRLEFVLESRTALQDLHHAAPWISWDWTCTVADGTTLAAHPEGANGADEFVHPFRVYSFLSRVRSFAFNGVTSNNSVYYLRFPPIVRADIDGDGRIDLADVLSLPGCVVGPGSRPLPDGCTAYDLNRDRTLDLRDLAALQRQFGTWGPCNP